MENEIDSGYAFGDVRLLAPDKGLKEEVPDGMDESEWNFMGIADALRSSGYCLMQTTQNQRMLELALGEADQIMDFKRPYSQFEIAYLGTESSSKVWWCQEDADPSLAKPASEQYSQQIDAVQDLLASMTTMVSATLAEPKAGPKLFRRTCKNFEEHARLHSDLGTADPAIGAEARFLDFVQRRRLCMIYVLNCSDSTFIEFRPRDDEYLPWSGAAKLQLAAGQLLVFQHDLLAYTYQSEDSNDLVLQSWLLDEPRSLEVNELLGNDEAIFAAFNAKGAMLSRNDEVGIKSVSYRLSCGVRCLVTLENMVAAMGDGISEIPAARWDYTEFYDPTGNAPGKCACRHAGFLDFEQFGSFDCNLFGYKPEECSIFRPSARVAMENSYEAFVSSGFTMDMLRGANISMYTSSTDGADWLWKMENTIGTKLTDRYQQSMMLAHQYGLSGLVTFLDTACSSTNVTANLSLQTMRINRDGGNNYALERINPEIGSLICGDTIFDSTGLISAFVGLSKAGMVGKKGRSRTFDNTADGFQRGEGAGAFYQCLLDGPSPGEEIVHVLGGAINQDGRSASLTAPSGPSQGKILRLALDDIKRPIEDTTTCELHGTGTALGDPIETGSVRSMMVHRAPGTQPLLHSAGKSQTNHQELAAGLSGMIRQIIGIVSSTSPSNAHIYTLNTNIENVGYPAFWPTERVLVGLEYIHNGVSSFGFGGTNARYELWGQCRKGLHKAVRTEKTQAVTVAYAQTSEKTLNWDRVDHFFSKCPQCLGTMCWLSGEALDAEDFCTPVKHRPTMVRSENATYDVCSFCYKGDYIVPGRRFTEAGPPGGKVYIVLNLWNGVLKEEMQQMLDGSYVYTMNLDETGPVNFNISYDGDPSLTLYPVVPNAPQQARVLGPDSKVNGRSWLIDTNSTAIFASTIFQVRLHWGSHGGKFVSWEALSTPQPHLETALTYSIVGSWNAWKPEHMMQSEEDPTLWEFCFMLSEEGEDQFQFICGEDFSRAIFPDGKKVDDTSIHIKGPSSAGHGKNWLVAGKAGEMVKVHLEVKRGHITMSTIFEASEPRTKTWKSPDRSMEANRQLFIAGSWNNWSPDEELQPTAPDVYVFHLTLQQAVEEFQIVVDKDWSQTMYAHSKGTLQLGNACRVDGPDGDGHGKNFKVKGPVGAILEICLDLSHSDGPSVSCSLQG